MSHEELLRARLKASRYEQLCSLIEYSGTLSVVVITLYIILH